jgi:unsaturated chondroitin disaccharide hydrolase
MWTDPCAAAWPPGVGFEDCSATAGVSGDEHDRGCRIPRGDPMRIDLTLEPVSLAPKIDRLWDLSAVKIRAIERRHRGPHDALVYTVGGRYTSRRWTEWTLGFRYGSALLQFDATGEQRFLDLGRRGTLDSMGPHLTDTGVHDHGFTIVSTYGALLRLMREGRLTSDPWERRCYEIALKCSAAVQARRWTALGDSGGFIHSFNGPQSLFVDTIRTLRSLAVGHRLGHVLLDEGGRRVSLLDRLAAHAQATARYLVSDGRGRDMYAARGRTTHEAIFSVADHSFRCLSTQQGYSPFTAWMRGLAWAMCGFAEQLEFLETVGDGELKALGGRKALEGTMRRAACDASDFYIGHTAADGIPYWDAGAPGLHRLGDYRAKAADPFNPFEPVDSSAAAIAAQGLLRMGHYLRTRDARRARRYFGAGLTVLATLLDAPYLSVGRGHEGLLLHSVYHRPNGWDSVPAGCAVPCGESSMWGDYHLREASLYVQRLAGREPYLTFWGPA